MISVPPDCILTPSARDFLRAHGVKVQVTGGDLLDLNLVTLSTAPSGSDSNRSRKRIETGAVANKPEHRTHLRKDMLVDKTHPVIAWRGQLDKFDCALVEAQVRLAAAGEDELTAALEEILRFAQRMMAAEVRGETFTFETLLGWTSDEIREMSHHPERYFGTGHTKLDYRDGAVVARLHSLRATVREVELYANCAFCDEAGECERPDIILALNRLSSLLYVLACKKKAGQGVERRLSIGVSNRHIHLSQAHLEALFGAGHALETWKDLSQPGQFAAKETVQLLGPKGTIPNVRVLGPVRKETQVEISTTDSFVLGVTPVVRDSGQHEGSVGLRLQGPAGTVELTGGVIVAARHIHIHPDQAKQWRLQDGQRVRVRIDSERPMILNDVLVRVNPQFRGELHLDTDEANAALVTKETQGIILEG